MIVQRLGCVEAKAEDCLNEAHFANSKLNELDRIGTITTELKRDYNEFALAANRKFG